MKWRHGWKFVRELFLVLPKERQHDWCELGVTPNEHCIVVLVSGFGATSRNVSVLRKRFLKDQIGVIVLPLSWTNWKIGWAGLSDLAAELKISIGAVRKSRARLPVFVVAHSAGGLVARHFIQVLGGGSDIVGLICLATPHRGTWVAIGGLFTHLILKARVLIEMLPSSPFIQRINNANWPSDLPFLNLHSEADLLCPPSTTRLPRNINTARNVRSLEISDLSHSGFLLSRRCYESIHSFIREQCNEWSTPQREAL